MPDLDSPTKNYGTTKGSLYTASSPVARYHWGIFELIIKESGDEVVLGPNELKRVILLNQM